MQLSTFKHKILFNKQNVARNKPTAASFPPLKVKKQSTVARKTPPSIKHERVEMGVLCLPGFLHPAAVFNWLSKFSPSVRQKKKRQADVRKRVIFRRRPTAEGGFRLLIKLLVEQESLIDLVFEFDGVKLKLSSHCFVPVVSEQIIYG